MQLSLVAAPFDDPDWVFEIKHDGFRALAYIGEGTCTLLSRKNNWYKSFAALRESLAKLKANIVTLRLRRLQPLEHDPGHIDPRGIRLRHEPLKTLTVDGHHFDIISPSCPHCRRSGPV